MVELFEKGGVFQSLAQYYFDCNERIKCTSSYSD